MPSLRGTYCRLCENASFFYIAATSTESAHCRSCRDLMSSSLGPLAAISIALLGGTICASIALMRVECLRTMYDRMLHSIDMEMIRNQVRNRRSNSGP